MYNIIYNQLYIITLLYACIIYIIDYIITLPYTWLYIYIQSQLCKSTMFQWNFKEFKTTGKHFKWYISSGIKKAKIKPKNAISHLGWEGQIISPHIAPVMLLVKLETCLLSRCILQSTANKPPLPSSLLGKGLCLDEFPTLASKLSQGAVIPSIEDVCCSAVFRQWRACRCGTDF